MDKPIIQATLKFEFDNGSIQLVPLLVFDDPIEARNELSRMKPRLAELLNAQLVKVTGGGGEMIGLSGAEFLKSLGVSEIGLSLTKLSGGEKMEASNIVIPN